MDKDFAKPCAAAERGDYPVRQCAICGGSAYRRGAIVQCGKNPGHVADQFVGIFSDLTYPKE